MPNKNKILIIEDEINTIRAAVKKLEKRNNTIVKHVVFMEDAEEFLKTDKYDLLVVDARIPGIRQDSLVEEGGLDLMKKLVNSEFGNLNNNTMFIILSSQAHSLRNEEIISHELCGGLFPKLLYTEYMNFIEDALDE